MSSVQHFTLLSDLVYYRRLSNLHTPLGVLYLYESAVEESSVRT